MTREGPDFHVLSRKTIQNVLDSQINWSDPGLNCDIAVLIQKYL